VTVVYTFQEVNAKGLYLLLYLIAHRTIITLSPLYCGELELNWNLDVLTFLRLLNQFY